MPCNLADAVAGHNPAHLEIYLEILSSKIRDALGGHNIVHYKIDMNDMIEYPGTCT